MLELAILSEPVDSVSSELSDGYFWCGLRQFNVTDSAGVNIDLEVSELHRYADLTYTYKPDSPGVFSFVLFFTLQDYNEITSEMIPIEVLVTSGTPPHFVNGGPGF